ncbi:hypothetical protein [Streptomyces sp. bgisy029]|uniref:hypothetical protein n=1 Tax=Streptomyces sp. bgisy029 TaxID=3413771 RepID=UPI003D740674
MTSSEYLSSVILTGSIFGFSVGSALAEIEVDIPLRYIEEVTDDGAESLLRRDYGFFEVTCAGGPDWRCRWISIEIHRLASSPEVIAAAVEALGVEFAPYIPWSEVHEDYLRNEIAPALDLKSPEGYRVFRNTSTGVSVHVVDDLNEGRGELPGNGDIWSMDIMSPEFMR